MFKKILFALFILLVGLFAFLAFYTPSLSNYHGKIQTELFLGDGENQPLIVGFGGGEGGNAWASDYWKETRDQFLEEGYAFLAIGYFGMKGTPQYLDRISLNAIYDSIIQISANPKIDGERIALIGGSKGGELALNLASRYDDIDAVVAIVTSHVSFPALTYMANTSSWTFDDEEVPFVPAPFEAVPAMLKHDLHRAFSIMLEDNDAEELAFIEVQNINGAILLVSATKDEFWPSTDMSGQIMERLKRNNFEHYYEHLPIEGSHSAPLDHFDEISSFLKQNFKEVD